jgi:hypothetical protein
MAQFARPASDITTGWATTPLWSKIDEVTPLDADWITGTGNVTAEVLLSTVTDPADNTNHIWSLRFQATGSGGKEKITAGLYEGTTLIEEFMTGVNITRNSFNLHTGTILESNAANIVDYTDLRIRMVSSQGGTETIDCSWAELSIPDAASVPVDEDVSLAVYKGQAASVYASIPDNFSIGRSAGQSAAELGNLQETATLAKTSDISPSTLVNGVEVVSLNRINFIPVTSLTTEYDLINLGHTRGLSVLEAIFVAPIEENVSLARLAGMISYSQPQINENVGLAYVISMISASQEQSNESISLTRLASLMSYSQALTNDSATLARLFGLSVLEDLIIPINESISLARFLGSTLYSQVIGGETINLNRISAIPAASLGIVYDLINLGHTDALTILEETQGQVNESIILARLLGITSYSQVFSNEVTSLSSFYGLGAAAQRISDEAVIFSSFYGLSIAELFEASELVTFARTNSVSLVDNAMLFNNISLLKVNAILAEGPVLYIFAKGDNAFGIVYRDKRLRVVFRDKRA